MIRRKIWKKLAPSTIAAFTNSVGKGLVVVPEEEGRKAKTVNHMDEDQIDDRVAEAERIAGQVAQRVAEAAEVAEDHRHRNDDRLERDEAGEQHHAEHQVVARESATWSARSR
jgi:hypothetical protein